MRSRACKTCSTVFTPTHSRNIYCRPECRKDEHAKIEKACECCGKPCMKPPTTRYRATFCSMLCRTYSQWGIGQSCKLPPEHWGRWYARASSWTPPVIRNTGECGWCGAINPRGALAAYCGPRCKAHAKRQRRRAAEFDAPGEYTWAQIMAQYRRQGYVCAYCGERPSGLPEPEHVVPLSRGGRNDMTNIVAACKGCNSDKRDLLLDEWNADRARRGLAAVNVALIGKAYLMLAA
jgi:5-methylcytosine-specific restriction endonuclease McrA